MNRYTRMFPQLARPPATSEMECGLVELGKTMKRKQADDGGNNGTVAFYTYLGQMMDHDLTYDITPLRQAHPCENRIRNYRTPFLDLEVLYGGGPTVSPFLYDQTSGPGKERFLIGKTRTVDGKEGSDDDLPRNPQGIALVGDPRQDENLIVAQLHVFFLTWHNQLLDEFQAGEVQSVGPACATTFEQVRRLLTWTYQKLALGFVSTFVDPTVFSRVQDEFTATPSFENPCFRIPIEFNVAAFRFGHSMVRDFYDYNATHSLANHNPATLFELLEQTGMGGGACPRLGDEWIIDMTRFLDGQNGQKICPRIARDLFQLQSTTTKLFNVVSGGHAAAKCHCHTLDDPESMLPVKTLLRGARMGLPSGQDVAKALAIPPVTPSELGHGLSRHLVRKYRFHEDTPLWYYILREAELLGEDGHRLGPVGSRIVAETVLGALRADRNSYLSVYPSWKPDDIKPPSAPGQMLELLISSASRSTPTTACNNI
jgi:hypothetical protein